MQLFVSVVHAQYLCQITGLVRCAGCSACTGCQVVCTARTLCAVVSHQVCECRSLLERLLRARLVYQKANMARAISFEYLNRQLVWHELSELLLFVLPLVSVSRIKRMVTNRWPSLRAATGLTQASICHFSCHLVFAILPSCSCDDVNSNNSVLLLLCTA